jgi:hypothetical protein
MLGSDAVQSGRYIQGICVYIFMGNVTIPPSGIEQYLLLDLEDGNVMFFRNNSKHLQTNRLYNYRLTVSLLKSIIFLEQRQFLSSHWRVNLHYRVYRTISVEPILSQLNPVHITVYTRRSVVRVPGYRTEIYCASCEVRTEFIYVM